MPCGTWWIRGITGKALKDRLASICRDRVFTYPPICLCDLEKWGASYDAHHIRVGRSFLDFCRNLEDGPASGDTADYKPIAQEEVARACAALLDPLVARLGRVSVIRGIEAAGFASDACRIGMIRPAPAG